MMKIRNSIVPSEANPSATTFWKLLKRKDSIQLVSFVEKALASVPGKGSQLYKEGGVDVV